MLTKKDIALNDEYLNSLVQNSRRNDMSAFSDFAPISNVGMRTRDTIEEQQQANEEPAFTLITQIAFPLKCRRGFSGRTNQGYTTPRRKYALCCRCRQAVKIHQDQEPVRSGRKAKGVSTQ